MTSRVTTIDDNTNMRNKNITKKERRITMLHLDEIVAIKMQDGLTNEKEQIADIGRVLKEMGKDFKERNWLLSYDEDFIPDVLSYYNHKPNTEYGFFLSER